MTDKEIAVAVKCIEDRVGAARSVIFKMEMTDDQRKALQELEAAKSLLYVVNEHLEKNYEL